MMRVDTRSDGALGQRTVHKLCTAMLFSLLVIPTASGLVHGRLPRPTLAKTAVSEKQLQ
jgi:hypothetical protein